MYNKKAYDEIYFSHIFIIALFYKLGKHKIPATIFDGTSDYIIITVIWYSNILIYQTLRKKYAFAKVPFHAVF
ncbi:hypothetical protein OSO01_01450 [Oceanobacillus sojae]|uniref:Uncharacterized protein n=1 Tax=Oceanobacillus sojae TaxID=582851 RepID=A0A511ZD83_9BACI|nr:hypothetical protein OSO01_01450 [Oceanobacillus sojae]